MNILVAAFAYNERAYLPYMVEYYRSQGCELVILDNHSNDSTYEWLMDNNVRTRRVDTNESFHLKKLQAELKKEIVKLHPDWVLYCGVDCYYFFDKGIKEEIRKASISGGNVIEVNHFTVYNTGEKFALPFTENYFYALSCRKLQMIAKYDKNFELIADGVRVPKMNVFKSNGVFINYGMCKPMIERETTYARRKKAWQLGLHKGYGTHYAPAKENGWIWDRQKLTDIRNTRFYSFMK